MRHRPALSIVGGAEKRRRRARFVGWLRTAVLNEAVASRRRWLDIGQISDAMFMPFVEAVASRLPSGAPDVESHTHVAPNTRLGAYCTGRTTLDTGLRVLGRPILKLQETGAFVCEALPDEGFLLIYQPNRNEDLK
ncbi:hypothetical protein BDI4_830035 [Burkholderia diffusa]|uniref:hypothetical protein n=1 Tax=Burkholderia diffusa TaxID=488732 RepID=UPI001CB34FE0|nr:hypothetical protein [Burkholderia diffusa]CAG9264326.1 hypothetical protein BDI4_830035 [Burkholderia diffusa]